MVSSSTSLNPVEMYKPGWPAIRAGIYLAGQSRCEALIVWQKWQDARTLDAIEHWHLEFLWRIHWCCAEGPAV